MILVANMFLQLPNGSHLSTTMCLHHLDSYKKKKKSRTGITKKKKMPLTVLNKTWKLDLTKK